jgi:small subunit ribosomal protein S17
MSKRVLKGTVISHKTDKTVKVSVERLYQHPKYKKVLKSSKNYLVHDPKNECNVGDFVSIIESRPISKMKKFVLNEIIKSESEVKKIQIAGTEEGIKVEVKKVEGEISKKEE